MVHPEPPKPVEEREAPPPPVKTESVPVTKPLPEKTVEPMEQQVVEAPKTRPEPVTAAKEPEPIQATEPVIAQQSVAPPAESVEQQPVETPVKPSASDPVASSSPEPPAAVPTPPSSAAAEAPAQVAKAAPPGPEARTDHRWLAESLWRRVAELKRYPTSARLNGQEGKVILKAVIRSDGHLAEVSVQKSSGHHILDAAAMEAVKLACPLHMKHAISKPEIVVSLPIVYSLAN
jgi:protein TonB